MANLSLIFDVLAKDHASDTFRKVGDEAERSGRKAESGLGSIVGAAKVAGAAILGAGIITGFRELYDAAAESARITALTESAIRSTGGAANVSASQVGELAAAISAKTGIDDEAIQSGQNLLLTFTNVRNEVGAGNDIFSQASSILADMSTVLGTDASGSAVQLGKALNDPISGIGSLSRAGVQFTEQQKDQIRTLVESGDVLGAQQIILAELTTQFGGAAEAAGTPLDKMKVSVGNIAEEIGSYLIPLVDDFATTGVTAIEGISAGFSNGETSADGFEGAMQDVGVALRDVADVGGAVVGAGQDVVGFIGSIPPEAQAAAGALGAVALLKGPLVDMFETVYLKSLQAKDALGGGGLSGALGATKGAASGLLGVFGGPWGIALAGAAAGVAYVSSEMAEADSQTQAWTQTILDGSAAATDLNEAYLAQYGGEEPDWLQQQSELLGFTSSLEDAEANARELYEAMNPLAQAQQNVTHDTNRLVQAIDEFGENSPQAQQAAELLAASNERLADRQDAVTRATEAGTAALDPAAAATQIMTTTQEALAEGSNAARTAVDGIRLALEQLGGQAVNTAELEAQYYAAVAEATGATDELSGSVLTAAGDFDRQSEAGRTAQDVLFGIRDRGLDLIANQGQLGESTEMLTGRATSLRDQFIAAAGQMNINADEANALADQYGLIPASVVTDVQANTAGAAANLTTLQTQIDNLRGKDITIRASTSLSGLNGGPVPVGGRAMGGPGGPVRGPGTGTSDTAGLWALSNGEHVWTDAEVQAAGGHDAMEKMRRAVLAGGRGLAEGGPVITINMPSRQSLVDDISTSVTASGALEPATGLVAALQYAQAQIGKPYSWGSAGPAGFDCSGFMSAITNVARGRNPNSRLGSTASFPWAGFADGDGFFTIGSTPNAGGGIGHMAGTLLGVNVESRGGQGVVVGGSARGAHDRIFKERAHLATYDTGGLLQPGYTLAFNGTGKQETIRTAEQEAELVQTGQVNHISIQVDRDAERIARATVRALAEREFLHG